MGVPQDRKYSETHEWYQVDGQIVTVGITQFAADELTDITYVELPDVGSQVHAGDPCGEIESVKATGELVSAVGGRVTAANQELSDHPELVNDDAFEKGWMIKIECDDLAPLESMMDGKAYENSL